MPINSFLAHQPIKLEGFDLPGLPPVEISADPLGSSSHGNGYIDPADLFGFDSHHQHLSHHQTLPLKGGGASSFSDLDLDFEHTLASLLPSTPSIGSIYSQHSLHSSQNQRQLHDLVSNGGGGGGSFGNNAFSLGAVGHQHGVEEGRASAMNGGGSGHQYSHSISSNAHPHHHIANPISSLPPDSHSYYSPASTSTLPTPFASTTSPRDSTRSPSAPTHDLYGASPATTGGAGDYGSYSSVISDVRPSSTTAASVVRSSSTSKRRSSPAPVAGEGRSRSSAIGKAPNSSSRSRSVRRASSSSGSYAPPPAASSSASSKMASPGSQPLPPTLNHGVTAIVIPSASSSIASPHHQHVLASMSMPAFPTILSRHAGESSSNPASSWYPTGSPGSATTTTSRNMTIGRSQSTEKASKMDSATGWRPANLGGGPSAGVPSSAPTLGASKKAGKGLDNVPEDPTSKQAIAQEKRQKRRESHNAVERRRRDNINDRITELAALLPECLLEQVSAGDDLAPPESPAGLMSTSPAALNISSMSISATSGSTMSAAAAAAAARPNKGIILAKSVDYIRYLQQLVDLHSSRNAELERTVMQLRTNEGGSSGATSSSSEDRSPRELNVVEAVGAGLNDPDFNSRFLISASRGDFGKGAEKWGFRNEAYTFDEDDDMEG